MIGHTHENRKPEQARRTLHPQYEISPGVAAFAASHDLNDDEAAAVERMLRRFESMAAAYKQRSRNQGARR